MSADGADPLNYNWRLNGSNLPGATNASLILTNVQSVDSGDYSVIITNRFGTTASPEARLAVVSRPRLGLTQILPSAQLKVTVTGDPDRAYELQNSSNLADWFSSTNLFINRFGQVEFTDTIATNAATRFYRALTLP